MGDAFDLLPSPLEKSFDSSFLESASYNPLTTRLIVFFIDGNSHAYTGVLPPTWLAFISSGDPGRFFNAEIRNKYR